MTKKTIIDRSSKKNSSNLAEKEQKESKTETIEELVVSLGEDLSLSLNNNELFEDSEQVDGYIDKKLTKRIKRRRKLPNMRSLIEKIEKLEKTVQNQEEKIAQLEKRNNPFGSLDIQTPIESLSVDELDNVISKGSDYNPNAKAFMVLPEGNNEQDFLDALRSSNEKFYPVYFRNGRFAYTLKRDQLLFADSLGIKYKLFDKQGFERKISKIEYGNNERAQYAAISLKILLGKADAYRKA